MNYKIKINDAEYEVYIRKVEDKKAQVTVNGENFEVEVEGLVINPTRMSINLTPKLNVKPVNTPVVKPVATQSAYEVKPPLPGIILDICVKEGMKVHKGQVLYVLEAMKMENHIESDCEGTVEKIFSTKGEPVLENDVILIIN